MRDDFFHNSDILATDAVKDLPNLQKAFFSGERILPALPRALHVEPGIMGKYGLPADDDRAARYDAFILVVFLSGNFPAVINGWIFDDLSPVCRNKT